MTSIRRIVTLLSLSVLLIFPTHFVTAQSAVTRAVEKPYIVEWVYRVKWGPQEEWLDIFRKYQVAILDKQKQLGYVKDYTISAPSLHTSEYARWDHRVIIEYKGPVAPDGESDAAIAKQLFPNQKQFKADEQRRWELTLAHWDLPIHVVTLTDDE